MKQVTITSKINTTVVRRGQVKEVDATPWVKEMIEAGTILDVTPKPKRKRTPKPKVEESDDATDDDS